MVFKKIVFYSLIIVFVLVAGCTGEQPDFTTPPASTQQNKPSHSSNNGGGGGRGGGSSIIEPDDEQTPVTVVSILPNDVYITSNDSFTVNLFCEPIQPVKAWEMTISFDPNHIRANDAVHGSFFDEYETFTSWNTIIDNINGTISRFYHLIIGPGVVNTSGILATLYFETSSPGVSLITFTMLGLTNETMYIPVRFENCTIHISP